MATKKDRLHWLVEQLPPSETRAAERYLEYLRASSDPVLRALIEAPYDDEDETEDELAGLEDARRDMAEGRVEQIAATPESDE